MHLGLFHYPTTSAPPPTEVAARAEDLGLESVFVPEHSHIPVAGTGLHDLDGKPLPDEYRSLFDPFLTLTAMASVTQRLLLGTAVCVVSHRDPILCAKQVATLDHLSGGRLLFGVGAGWHPEELRSHGVRPEQRLALLREKLDAMRAIWTQDEASYAGELVAVPSLWQWPKPQQRPHPPILLGGDGPGAIDRVLDIADGWIPTHRGGDIADRVADLRERARRRGRGHVPVTAIVPMLDLEELVRLHRAGVDRTAVRVPSGSHADVFGFIAACAAAHDHIRGSFVPDRSA